MCTSVSLPAKCLMRRPITFGAKTVNIRTLVIQTHQCCAVKTYGCVEVTLHALLTLALDGGEG